MPISRTIERTASSSWIRTVLPKLSKACVFLTYISNEKTRLLFSCLLANGQHPYLKGANINSLDKIQIFNCNHHTFIRFITCSFQQILFWYSSENKIYLFFSLVILRSEIMQYFFKMNELYHFLQLFTLDIIWCYICLKMWAKR